MQILILIIQFIKKHKLMNIRLLLHISIVLNIFLLVWMGVEWLNIHENGIWFGYAAALFFSIVKELYDKFSENGSGFIDQKTLAIELIAPTLWMIIYYILYR